MFPISCRLMRKDSELSKATDKISAAIGSSWPTGDVNGIVAYSPRESYFICAVKHLVIWRNREPLTPIQKVHFVNGEPSLEIDRFLSVHPPLTPPNSSRMNGKDFPNTSLCIGVTPILKCVPYNTGKRRYSPRREEIESVDHCTRHQASGREHCEQTIRLLRTRLNKLAILIGDFVQNVTEQTFHSKCATHID